MIARSSPRQSRQNRDYLQSRPENFGDSALRLLTWRFRNRMLLPVRGSYKISISLQCVNISKHSNFENLTEFAESRAPERNERSEKNKPTPSIRWSGVQIGNCC